MPPTVPRYLLEVPLPMLWPPGLPDGIFSNKNPNLGKFWEGLEMENINII
jgi:hypothetical protein